MKKIIENQINHWVKIIFYWLSKSLSIRKNHSKIWKKLTTINLWERLIETLNLNVLMIPKKEDRGKVKPLLWQYLEIYLKKINN